MEEETISDVVPSLEDVLDLIKRETAEDKQFVINLEIKDSDPYICNLILDQIIAKGLQRRVYLSSFHHFMKEHIQTAA